jgi:hypothetical protein
MAGINTGNSKSHPISDAMQVFSSPSFRPRTYRCMDALRRIGEFESLQVESRIRL